MIRARIIGVLLLGITAAVAPASRAQAPSHSKVALVSDQSAVHPGEEISLGFKFDLDAGWHTYWINPGDSGQPAFVRWQLPPGWQPGAMLWPVPARIPDHSLIDYGYENQVLLIVPVRAPATLHAGGKADVHATVQWLVCRDVCVPAQANVALTLPVSGTARPEYSRDHELFESTRRRLPAAEPARWRASAQAEGDHFVLQVETGGSETAKTFLPLDPGQIENAAAPVITRSKRGVRIMLNKSDQLAGPISHLRGILVMTSGRGFTIDAPVRSLKR
ncbi:MAG: protein-disulfide reductase DsbD domain-containing protein [Terriglobia bacterium]